jgi:uncharacterized repeat protein (TIGR01451 family)
MVVRWTVLEWPESGESFPWEDSVVTSVTSSNLRERATVSGLAGLAVLACLLAFGASQAQSSAVPSSSAAGSAVAEPPVVPPPASAPQRATLAPTDPADALIAYMRPGAGDIRHIWTMRQDASQQTDLTQVQLPAGTEVEDMDPAWSPDGNRIAFSRRAVTPPQPPAINGDSSAAPVASQDIWVMNADGTGLTNVSAPLRGSIGIGSAYRPAWSADGSRIAFSISNQLIVFEVANPASFYRINPPGRDSEYIDFPAFSPDGTKIAFSADFAFHQANLWVANVDGSNPVQYTSDHVEPGQAYFFHDQEANWSPDSRTIAFSRETITPLNQRTATNLIDANGQNLRVLNPGSGLDEDSPTWSPDGARIAASAYNPVIISGGGALGLPVPTQLAPSNQNDLWSFDANGANPVELTSTGPSELKPAWQPTRPTADLALYKSTSLDPVIVDVAPKAQKTTKAQLDKAKLGTSSIPDVEPGDEFTYYLDVYNNGPRAATNITVTDELPPEMEFVSASTGCTGTTTVTCTAASLASGFSIRFEIHVRVKADAKTGDVVNTAMVTGDTEDPNAGNNSDDATVHVIADADVDIDKRAIQGESTIESAEPGDEFRYLLDVFNSGPATAHNVVVSDTLPDQIELVSLSSADCTGTTTITCQAGSLDAGQGRTFTIRVRVKLDAAGDAVNTATVTTTSTDPDPDNNSGSVTVHIISDADVRIFKSTSLDEGGGDVTARAQRAAKAPDNAAVDAAPGTEFTYILDVNNAGPARARNVTVVDTLPAEVEILSVDEGCERQGQTVTCNAGTMSADSWTTFRIEVRILARCGDIVNTANVRTDSPDPNQDNNTATHTVHIICADLTVDKADTPDPVLLGDEVTYTVTVINHGTDTAVDVQLTDTLPADVDLVSTAPAGDCSADGQTISCALGDIPADETRTVTIVVLPRNPGEIVNTARVSSETADPDESNNTDSETTLVRGTDIAVTVTDDPDPVPFGELLTYTVTVTNNGPQTAQVEVVDTLPSAVRVESVPANCTVNGRVIRCQLGALEPEATTTVEIAVRPFVVGDIVNRTQVLLDIPDSDPASNRVDTTTTVRGTGLSIQATASPEPVDGGQPLTYEVVAANSGPAAAADTVVVISWNFPPPAATIDSSTPCTVANRQLRCELGTLPAGDSRTFTVTVVPNRAGELTTTLDALTTVPDEDPEDNRVVLTSNVRPADLVLTQQIAPRPGFVGGIVTYTLRVTNTGTAIARDVTLIDRIPAGPKLGTVTPSAGTCVVAPVLRCELGDLAPGAAPVTVVVKVLPAAAGSIVTSALATTSTTEPDLTDNEVRAATPVLQPRLELPKVGSPGFTQLVVGRDFPANTDVTLRWDKGVNPALGSTTVRSDANGVFRFRMLVLPRDQIGQRNAVAVGPADSFADVTAPHLVVPNPVAPRRFISRR